MDEEQEKQCLCLGCLYGAQPYGYFPIVCVQGKRSRTMYHETFTCRHFEPCPDETEEDTENDNNELNETEQ